ncbi:MAG: hypothetical protein ACI9U2_005140 [Bradymonadia bacterium]|jgi:hypothetical protein
MGKMIVPVLALVVVGVAAWFLLSTDDTARTVPKIQPAAAVTAAPASNAQNAATPRTPRRPIVKNALPKRALKVRPKGGRAGALGTASGSPVNTPVAAATPPPARPIVKQPLEAVQASVRQFYGNLPKSGKVPGRVTLEEVLPTSVIEQLGAPRDAQITMLGPYQISEARAFKDVLEMDQRYDTMLGVSWTREDGTSTRDYIALEAPNKPSP